MATKKQRAAARRNVKQAQKAAQRKRTIAHLPKKTRTALGKQASMVARRTSAGTPRSLDERTRSELAARARELGIEGRSKMGKGDLVRAIRSRE